jgi:outer membrane beta-barrel protein
MIGPLMKTRSVKSLALGAAVLFSLLSASLCSRTAEAQEIQLTGPLAGAPAVRHEQLYREGRFELAPTVSFTLLDEYSRAILFGARAQYNITDWISLGVWGAYGAVQIDTDLTDKINGTAVRGIAQTATNVPPAGTNFDSQIGRIQWVAVPQLQLTPFRGKLAIFQKIFINADAYIHWGFGITGLQERGDCGSGGQPSCRTASTFSTTSRIALSPGDTFGLGFNFYIGNFLSLGAEYRALPFSWNQGGFDTRGGNPNGNFPDNKITSADELFKFNQMLTVSLGFSFPTTPKLSD